MNIQNLDLDRQYEALWVVLGGNVIVGFGLTTDFSGRGWNPLSFLAICDSPLMNEVFNSFSENPKNLALFLKVVMDWYPGKPNNSIPRLFSFAKNLHLKNKNEGWTKTIPVAYLRSSDI